MALTPEQLAEIQRLKALMQQPATEAQRRAQAIWNAEQIANRNQPPGKSKGGSIIKQLEEYLRQREGEYGVKRLQRAADEIPGLEKMYTLEALKRAFGGDNAQAASSEVVVIATPWDSAATTAQENEEALVGKVVVSMANALVRVGHEFQPLVPPRGSVAAHVQAAVPKSRVVAAFHHLPATELGHIGEPIESDVLICKDGDEVNGKSIMGVLMLAAAKGSEIKVVARGPDAEACLCALGALIADKFGEGE